jgi:bifunctional oligoribonuclease and PAP phosphatase NrnA
MTKTIDQRVAEQIKISQTFLVVSHIRPDADAGGSVLGLGLALKNAGKTVQLVLADGGEKFHYLPGWQQIVSAPTGPADMIIIVDCSDPNRVGDVLDDYGKPHLVVDHHKTNLAFGEINVVEPEQVATAAILFDHIPSWGLTINADIATCLLAGIVGDTIGFRTPNVNAELMRKAAALMDLGGDLPRIYNEELVLRSFIATRYWGAGLTRLESNQGLVWTSLTLADREEIGYPSDDDADLVNVLSAVREAKIALIFVEQPKNSVKVSWRTGPEFDVSGIAYQFGGGGHAAAAGADIEGTLADVKHRVLQETRKILESSSH